MTLRLVVSCDSDPAAYAPAGGQPCRGWFTAHTDTPVAAHLEAARAGWTIELTVDPATGVNTYRHTCPACTRARKAAA